MGNFDFEEGDVGGWYPFGHYATLLGLIVGRGVINFEEGSRTKMFMHCILYRPELRKCVFYRPITNSGCTSCIMLKLYTMIDIDNSFWLKMKIFAHCIFYRTEIPKCVF